MRGLVAALVSVAVGLVGAPLTIATSAGDTVRIAVHTYDTVAYAYDAPAQLLPPDTVATDARGSPPGTTATPWARSVGVGRHALAANTGRALASEPDAGRNAGRAVRW